MCGSSSCAGIGRAHGFATTNVDGDASGIPKGRTLEMHGHGQSDAGIVPTRPPNEAWYAGAEAEEGRLAPEGKVAEDRMSQTQGWKDDMTTMLDRLRAVVNRDSTERFTALYHHVTNVAYLREAYDRLRPAAAAGVDGVTWAAYGEQLEDNLQRLAARLSGGTYVAPAVRRVYIPKADGRQRPLGIPTLEDKLVQWVVAQVCSTIWEEAFVGFSYGFRPGRGAHDALDALVVGIEQRKVNWVLDADLEAFFDTVSHGWMLRFLRHRIGDERVIRLIWHWLTAGVLEDGRVEQREAGTPQGGVISPILANIYLHYAFDQWVAVWRKRHARGDVIVVRYADDFVVGFERRGEAEAFRAALTERLGRFTLRLHAEKTRLLEFGRFAQVDRAAQGAGKPETFTFLGFTFRCGKHRKGGFHVLRETIRKRMQATLQRVKAAMLQRREQPLREQGRWVQRVVLGHYRYFGVPKNGRALWAFREGVRRHWQTVLRRRSQRGRVSRDRMDRLSAYWLPLPQIVHPYPAQRLHVST